MNMCKQLPPIMGGAHLCIPIWVVFPQSLLVPKCILSWLSCSNVLEWTKSTWTNMICVSYSHLVCKQHLTTPKLHQELVKWTLFTRKKKKRISKNHKHIISNHLFLTQKKKWKKAQKKKKGKLPSKQCCQSDLCPAFLKAPNRWRIRG